MAKEPESNYDELRQLISNNGGFMLRVERHVKGGAWIIFVGGKIGVFTKREGRGISDLDGLYEMIEESATADLIRRADAILDDEDALVNLEPDYYDVAGLILEMRDALKRLEGKRVSVRRLKSDAYETLLNWLEEPPTN